MKYLKNYNTFILEDFDFTNIKLTTLLGLGIPEIGEGDFSCSQNKLKNLVGSPKKVIGRFDCHNNNLTSLEGAPEYVGGNFVCFSNNLTSLEGAPKYVGGNFDCRHNKLTTLDHLPENFNGHLYCGNNNWSKPIPYKIFINYNLILLNNGDHKWVYTTEQYKKFCSFEFQKEFLEREPENYFDLKPIGYAEGIEELFPHLFDMDELGLID